MGVRVKGGRGVRLSFLALLLFPGQTAITSLVTASCKLAGTRTSPSPPASLSLPSPARKGRGQSRAESSLPSEPQGVGSPAGNLPPLNPVLARFPLRGSNLISITPPISPRLV
ncbi:hypothetical protein Pmani_031085 [Petrolisthes manimaculis]|uniref:Uncharacterized protein n=1 Tax=Petrolisthes manimaculis TaxID=1843537 RepID=A0AAE1NVC9_9EUCA|nr:hypothetical protein Pmani_031085 [Petrolisthes manimaculis]